MNGNRNYKKFFGKTIKTSVLNLAELYYALIKNFSKEKANALIAKMKFDLIEIAPEIALRAAYFRFLNKRKKLSLVDCIGYAISEHYGLKFVTGDNQFKDLADVEFVK